MRQGDRTDRLVVVSAIISAVYLSIRLIGTQAVAKG